MKAVQRPSGIVVLESESKPEPKKQREYRCRHYGDIGCIKRMIEHIIEKEAELVSVVRHGPRGSGIVLDAERAGYVITYLHHEVIGTWEYT